MVRIKRAVSDGAEHTRCALMEHDRTLGRTTRKNHNWAVQLEDDLANLEKVEKELNELPL